MIGWWSRRARCARLPRPMAIGESVTTPNLMARFRPTGPRNTANTRPSWCGWSMAIEASSGNDTSSQRDVVESLSCHVYQQPKRLSLIQFNPAIHCPAIGSGLLQIPFSLFHRTDLADDAPHSLDLAPHKANALILA